LFLCGDVMTGRGVDQILERPGAPALRESYVKDARGYVALAEGKHGPIPAPVGPPYIWGQGLGVLDERAPDVRIVNLETSITVSDDFWPGKAVHYRMNPDNIACLRAAGLDLVSLANNHVLDFGLSGLRETLHTLAEARIRVAGAGRDLAEAQRPVAFPTPEGRVLVAACGMRSSGIPSAWAATGTRPGVHLLSDLSARAAERLAAELLADRRPGDVAIVSIHWGSNWGYEIAPAEVRFAHRLIDLGVDLVHGHSSHHVRPLEVYRGRLILYGCGDLITDYEGIKGHESYRGDLGLMYFARLAPDGALARLEMVPMQIQRMSLTRPGRDDVVWLAQRVGEVSRAFGTRVTVRSDDVLMVEGA
jgi:poly-gamma-glutamate capsule biosynthesis protein CapA/YwtB (metallophosphatase superfamily)